MNGKPDRPGKQDRKERLAMQLRKNLHKRKAQARARRASDRPAERKEEQA